MEKSSMGSRDNLLMGAGCRRKHRYRLQAGERPPPTVRRDGVILPWRSQAGNSNHSFLPVSTHSAFTETVMWGAGAVTVSALPALKELRV